MNKELVLSDLKIEKAKETDWQEILKLLKETNLDFWFTGNENYTNFYTVKDPEDKNIVCCFAIEYENDIGVLKSFGVPKKLQGKGLGKKIANKTPMVARELGIKKFYAASQEAPEFWQKTIFEEIIFEEIKEKYFLDYLNLFCHRIPDYFKNTHYFLYVIN